MTPESGLQPIDFALEQRMLQTDYLCSTVPDHNGFGGHLHVLPPERRLLNLAPSIRELAPEYFGPPRNIRWHRDANNALSSQVCCLNFLMPLATRPDLLSRWVGHVLGLEGPEMLPVEEGPERRAWFVGFEWIGVRDYLGEGPKSGNRVRGEHVTSADAIVRFRDGHKIETLLIEWKYTESYGSPITNWNRPPSMETRRARYGSRAFAPNGPIRADLGLNLEDFYWEPLYQLMRQQTLALQMQNDREGGSDRVRVLHISPAANLALHEVNSPALLRFGEDVFEAFSTVLVSRDDFITRTTEQAFARLFAEMPDDSWADYLSGRYEISELSSPAPAGIGKRD